ncbi:hypothetical protein EU805_13955 [Salipiger sp. IMCC34102]|uniref:hypothetical protein n=1 Tax=Salipiger sp. IMCC34102 TaxID=2510647 RepID=UPI00101DDB18|nr:hypothetical protein [Salipiger sp. IMCC34102]RYH01358.1 hypothetical protein EU805_13955 [Salipiger sp. IMCC34102]
MQAYETHGIYEPAPRKIADILRTSYGGTNDAKRRLGEVAAIRQTFIGIQEHLLSVHRSPRRMTLCATSIIGR